MQCAVEKRHQGLLLAQKSTFPNIEFVSTQKLGILQHWKFSSVPRELFQIKFRGEFVSIFPFGPAKNQSLCLFKFGISSTANIHSQELKIYLGKSVFVGGWIFMVQGKLRQRAPNEWLYMNSEDVNTKLLNKAENKNSSRQWQWLVHRTSFDYP